MCQKVTKKSPPEAERLYRMGIKFKKGEGTERNLRDAYQKFKEASRSGHTEATKELVERYLNGRGCEKDVMKASEFGDSKLKLIIGDVIENEGKIKEYMRLYWIALDLGEAEATARLVDIYEKGEIVEKDIEESERLRGLLVTKLQKSVDLLEWRISQEDKTLHQRKWENEQLQFNKAPSGQ